MYYYTYTVHGYTWIYMGNAQDAQDAYCRLPPEKLPFKMLTGAFSKHHCVAGPLTK